jgi:hypothetical protein
MKQIFLLLLVLVVTTSVKAQLANKKWLGTLHLEQPTDVLLDFKKDSLAAITPANGKTLETMTFTVKGNILTLKKILGESECGVDIIGKYKFELKGNNLSLVLVQDDCYDRASALDKTNWNKQK